MNSLDPNSKTPMRYKHRSPVVNFLSKNSRTLSHSADLGSQQLHSRRIKESNSFHVFPVVKTPPAKQFSKIVNPFEAALAERLHLPLIGSPTLFHRPPTPQHSSTQFAWTIDDVSSLQPANVEPHETQFRDSPDPEYEAKAQSAISSYFKEQQIVPSPIDCSLRGNRIRDNVAQTILSLPPTLPKNLEAVLAPYFFFNENQQCSSTLEHFSRSVTEHDGRDASLRRKLFDYQNGMYQDDDTFAVTEKCVLTVNSPPPESPEIVNSKPILSQDSMDNSSFGSLSPIAQSSSPPNLKRKSRTNINSCNAGNSVARPFSSFYDNYRWTKTLESVSSPLLRDSPDRKSPSPYPALGEVSIDSIFDVKISGLLVDTTKRPKLSLEADLFADETQDMDDDDMQVSQLSAISNTSSESDTPRKRRSANRKNLSQSFSYQCSCNSDGDVEENDHDSDIKDQINVVTEAKHGTTIEADCKNLSSSECLLFHRTDSGFNEMTTSNSLYDNKCPSQKTTLKLSEDETTNKIALDICNGGADVSMICCSTPSKH